MRKLTFLSLGFLALAIAGCGGKSADRTAYADGRPIIRAALLLPLSAKQDDVREAAKALFQAAQLALFENDSANVILFPLDTGGSPAGAQRAARAAIEAEVHVILGPLLAESVVATALVARQANIPILAFSSDRTVAAENVYIMGFTPEDATARIISYARAQNINRFAALVPRNPYGQRAREAMTANMLEGELDAVVSYADNASATRLRPSMRMVTDHPLRMRWAEEERAYLKGLAGQGPRAYVPELAPLPLRGAPSWRTQKPTEALKQLKKRETLGLPKYQGLLIADGGDSLRTVASLLSFYDLPPSAVQFLGLGLWEDATLKSEPALEGGWFAAPAPETGIRFNARYTRAFPTPPLRLASLAYDAVSVLVYLARNGAEDQIFDLDLLAVPEGYRGMNGLFRFRPQGEVERALAVMEITPEELKVISSPIKGFVLSDIEN